MQLLLFIHLFIAILASFISGSHQLSHQVAASISPSLLSSSKDRNMERFKTGNQLRPETLFKRNILQNNPALQTTDPKTSEQVLELIVKIAEHPNTWKQIHRVLETLEANNAAYSKRIEASKLDGDKNWRKNNQLLSNKRNNIPEIMESISTTETSFQKWRDNLFPFEHPQLRASTGVENWAISPSHWTSMESPISKWNRPQSTSMTSMIIPTEKSFEDRLRSIEEELKKLSQINPSPFKTKSWKYKTNPEMKINKIPTPSPPLQNDPADSGLEKNISSKSNNSSKLPFKFTYHKVRDSSEDKPILEPNFWKRIVAARSIRNNTSQGKTYVAISLVTSSTSPPIPTTTARQPQLKESRLEEELVNTGLTFRKQKNHQNWKQKQRQQIGQQEMLFQKGRLQSWNNPN